MKKKLLAVALIGVIMGVGVVLFGCYLNLCPGGEAASGSCYFTRGTGGNYGTYKQCTRSCITAQGTYQGNGTYFFGSNKSCTCNY